MRNRFNLNESEKSRIRGLHNITPIYEEFTGTDYSWMADDDLSATFNFKPGKLRGTETLTVTRKETAPQGRDGCYKCILKDPRVIKMIEDGLQLIIEDGMCACFWSNQVDNAGCKTYDECCTKDCVGLLDYNITNK